MRLSLRQRSTILAVCLLSMALLVLSYLFSRSEEKFAIKQGEISRRHLTETFAISITNSLLYEELGLIEEGGLIENYIEEWMNKGDLSIEYIKVLNQDGFIIASNNLRQYGRAESDSLSKIIHESDSTLSHFIENNDPVLEISTPLSISTRSWGHLRVGYALMPLRKELQEVRFYHIMMVVAMVVISSIILAFYLHKEISPLVELRDFMDRAATESWLRSQIDRNDEIGDLARTFNSLLDQMEQARELERETQDKFYQTEKMSTIGKLAAGVAHEVRNPLAGIQNLVDNLEQYDVDSEKRSQYIEVIRDGLRRIERTVDGLVSFARSTPFSPEPTNAVELMENALALTAYPLQKSGITVKREFDKNLPDIVVDSDQANQVLLNIILNAIQAMEESGGVLTARVKMEDKRGVSLEVEDTGIGFPKKDRKKIFDPFYTTQPTGKGTGLGLAVSKSIVQRHGGQITVSSEEGKGAIFTVIFNPVS